MNTDLLSWGTLNEDTDKIVKEAIEEAKKCEREKVVANYELRLRDMQGDRDTIAKELNEFKMSTASAGKHVEMLNQRIASLEDQVKALKVSVLDYDARAVALAKELDNERKKQAETPATTPVQTPLGSSTDAPNAAPNTPMETTTQ